MEETPLPQIDLPLLREFSRRENRDRPFLPRARGKRQFYPGKNARLLLRLPLPGKQSKPTLYIDTAITGMAADSTVTRDGSHAERAVRPKRFARTELPHAGLRQATSGRQKLADRRHPGNPSSSARLRPTLSLCWRSQHRALLLAWLSQGTWRRLGGRGRGTPMAQPLAQPF
jgi:hypothetical protein